MGKKFTILLTLLLVSGSIYAQELFFKGELSTLLDNTEYAGSTIGNSRTIFAVRAVPCLGYRLDKNHAIVIGAELTKDFGSQDFLDSKRFVAYYQFENSSFGTNVGIFSREHLIGEYSRAIFSDGFLIYNNLIQGVAFRATRQRSYAEVVLDWYGLYSEECREKFRVLVSGGGEFANIGYAGAAFSMQHYANKSTFRGNVVDNIMLNPYIGIKFNAFFDFDIRLGALLSAQQDRKTDNGWVTPAGGEFLLSISRWGAYINNNLYVGQNLMPLYSSTGVDGVQYGDDLYTCDPFYSTTEGIYNRTGIGYSHSFAKDRVRVTAEVVLHYDGKRLFNQQLLGIQVFICPKLYSKKP